MVKTLFFSFLFLISALIITANNTNKIFRDKSKKDLFINLNIGTQISGINREDFINSNYSPLIIINIGKWFEPYLALSIGYKGYYFNFIGDNHKHNYIFFYGEAIFNINRLLLPKKEKHLWSFEVHSGAGYFYNYFYSQPNICASLDLSNKFQINNTFSVLLSASAILGWDIYQGDEDILPGATVGLVYFFP